MSERLFRQNVIHLLRPLDAQSVENICHPGTPDVNCTLGWIELKWVKSPPARPDTILAVRHFTPQQRVWLMRRWRAGGGAWLLLQCGKSWLLFTGETAADVVGRTPMGILHAAACSQWDHTPHPLDLISALKR